MLSILIFKFLFDLKNLHILVLSYERISMLKARIFPMTSMTGSSFLKIHIHVYIGQIIYFDVPVPPFL